MKKDAILFDLDGTLLPMDQESFVNAYFNELTKKLCPYGFNKELLIKSIWKGTYAMIHNNGQVSNEERFWCVFSSLMGGDILRYTGEFTSFYKNEFNNAKSKTGENPFAMEAIRLAREKAEKVVLATNPIFPLCAVESRLSWIGMESSDFDYITTYENSSFCKPNPDYYRQLLSKINANPAESVMIGNDVIEDALASRKVGIEAYIVTDCLIAEDKNNEEVPHGSFLQLLDFINSL